MAEQGRISTAWIRDVSDFALYDLSMTNRFVDCLTLVMQGLHELLQAPDFHAALRTYVPYGLRKHAINATDATRRTPPTIFQLPSDDANAALQYVCTDLMELAGVEAYGTRRVTSKHLLTVMRAPRDVYNALFAIDDHYGKEDLAAALENERTATDFLMRFAEGLPSRVRAHRRDHAIAEDDEVPPPDVCLARQLRSDWYDYSMDRANAQCVVARPTAQHAPSQSDIKKVVLYAMRASTDTQVGKLRAYVTRILDADRVALPHPEGVASWDDVPARVITCAIQGVVRTHLRTWCAV